MEEFKRHNIWETAIRWRKVQKLCGLISAILLGMALLALFDGLQAKMRAGSQELDLVQGETIPVSGPCPVKNPLISDVKVRLTPEDAPLAFSLEGFYTGYWFGSGMWRGQISCLDNAVPGNYEISISFKGASAQTVQKYLIRLYSDAQTQRGDSRSLIKLLTGNDPFIIAVIGAVVALFTGILTFSAGTSYMRELRRIGIYEAYRVDPANGLLWCAIAKNSAPKPGTRCWLYSPDGKFIGYAMVKNWQKGKLNLHCETMIHIPDDCLIGLDSTNGEKGFSPD